MIVVKVNNAFMIYCIIDASFARCDIVLFSSMQYKNIIKSCNFREKLHDAIHKKFISIIFLIFVLIFNKSLILKTIKINKINEK